MASSAFATGSRSSQEPTASSASAAAMTACTLGTRQGLMVTPGRPAAPSTTPCQSTGCLATAWAQRLHSRPSTEGAWSELVTAPAPQRCRRRSASSCPEPLARASMRPPTPTGPAGAGPRVARHPRASPPQRPVRARGCGALPQAQVMKSLWRSTNPLHSTAQQRATSSSCMRLAWSAGCRCAPHTHLAAMSAAAAAPAPHAHAVLLGADRGRTRISQGARQAAMSLQVCCSTSILVARTQRRVYTCAVLVGVLHQGAAMRCATADKV